MENVLSVLLLCLVATTGCGLQKGGSEGKAKTVHNQTIKNKMKVEIWSDVMCPFCYIGKAKFEAALAQFPHRDKIDIEWKSFQLMPELEPGKVNDLEKILVEKRGIAPDQAKAMNAQVTQAGKQVGLEFNFDKALAVNTFKAHQFTHFAKANGKQHEAEDILFRSYFTEGKNVDDLGTLLSLGKEIGLDADALKTALEDGSYASDVQKDFYEARQVGVRGVPFFVFDRKQAVSGAQDPTTFLQVLDHTYTEWQKANPEIKLSVIEGQACTPEGECK